MDIDRDGNTVKQLQVQVHSTDIGEGMQYLQSVYCSTVQYSRVQYSRVQYSRVEYSRIE